MRWKWFRIYVQYSFHRSPRYWLFGYHWFQYRNFCQEAHTWMAATLFSGSRILGSWSWCFEWNDQWRNPNQCRWPGWNWCCSWQEKKGRSDTFCRCWQVGSQQCSSIQVCSRHSTKIIGRQGWDCRTVDWRLGWLPVDRGWGRGRWPCLSTQEVKGIETFEYNEYDFENRIIDILLMNKNGGQARPIFRTI